MRSAKIRLSVPLALLLAACGGGSGAGDGTASGEQAATTGSADQEAAAVDQQPDAATEAGPPRGAPIDGSADPGEEIQLLSVIDAGDLPPGSPEDARRYDEYLAAMQTSSLDEAITDRAIATAPDWFRLEARRRGEYREHWAAWDEEAIAAGELEPVTAESLLAKEHLVFGDLALGDERLDQLLDVLLALDDFPEEPFEFPEAIQGLDGKKFTILGYMIPTQWEQSKVSSFMLVGDLLACCFGGTPLPDAWIDVTMEDGGTKYLPYTPVLVEGTFHISSEMPESGYFVGVYRMDGLSVVRQP